MVNMKDEDEEDEVLITLQTNNTHGSHRKR